MALPPGSDHHKVALFVDDDGVATVMDSEGNIKPLNTGGEGNVLAAGSVYNDGTIRLPDTDPGFSVNLVTDGGSTPGAPAEYAITFDVSLPVEPIITLTPNNNNGVIDNEGRYGASIKPGSISSSGFSVYTTPFNGTHTHNDGGFDFACFTPGVA